MGYNPDTNQLEPLSPELMAKLDGPAQYLTAEEERKRYWTKFHTGEELMLKGIPFRVHEIGENRIILKPFRLGE